MRRRGRGFTLVETIFSTLFISLTVLAIVNLFPGAYLSILRSETSIQADSVARSVLDVLRGIEFSALVNDDYVSKKAYQEIQSPVSRDGVNYTYEVETENLTTDPLGGSDPMPHLVRASVTVKYRVGFSLKEVRHETYFHRLNQ